MTHRTLARGYLLVAAGLTLAAIGLYLAALYAPLLLGAGELGLLGRDLTHFGKGV
jgi:hypothetical protein